MDQKQSKEASSNDRGKDDGKKTTEKQAAGPKSNKMLFIGIIAGVIVIEAILGIVLVKMTMPKPAGDEHAEKMHADSLQKHAEEMTAMGSTTAEAPIEAVVNIAGTDGERFLKAAVVLEYEDTGEHKAKGGGGGHGGGHGGGGAKSPLASAIEERMPKYKSILIDHLSKIPLADITSPDAKQNIRKDLLHIVNESLPPNLGEVKNVFFTEFIIQ